MKHPTTSMRLLEALSDNNISQQELADMSHIGKSSISHYINGNNAPGNKAAYMMASVLNVNPLWLMGLDVSKYVSEEESDPDKIEKALQLYNQYLNAISNIQKAVAILLDYPFP